MTNSSTVLEGKRRPIPDRAIGLKHASRPAIFLRGPSSGRFPKDAITYSVFTPADGPMGGADEGD